MVERLLVGLLLSGAIGGLAYRRHSLSASGVLGAILAGIITYMAGLAWALSLICFFVTSTLLSKIGASRKATAREQFSKGEQRDFAQVFANGGVATLLALAYLLTKNELLWLAYLGTLAAVNADTWGTEIGTLAGQPPRLITTLRRVDPGTSGGITLIGTLGATAGALTLALFGTLTGSGDMTSVIIVLCAGVIGSLFDSFLGATVQALYWCADRQRLTEKATCRDGTPAEHRQGLRWVNNEVVNISAALVGALIAGGWGVLS